MDERLKNKIPFPENQDESVDDYINRFIDFLETINYKGYIYAGGFFLKFYYDKCN